MKCLRGVAQLVHGGKSEAINVRILHQSRTCWLVLALLQDGSKSKAVQLAYQGDPECFPVTEE